MTIDDIIKKYDSRNELVIKVKNEVLDYRIKCTILKYDVHIFADSEKLCIDNKEIKLVDLETIYIWGIRDRYSLEIVQKGYFKGISLTITHISNEDIMKVNKLFEHFIFSNEKDLEKLTSLDYKPIDQSNSKITSKDYKINDKFISIDNDIVMLNNKYYLYKILPNKYYKKYSKKKEFIIYNSKFVNDNYIELWQNEENYLKLIHKNKVILYLKGIPIILIVLYFSIRLLIMCFDFIKSIFSFIF